MKQFSHHKILERLHAKTKNNLPIVLGRTGIALLRRQAILEELI